MGDRHLKGERVPGDKADMPPVDVPEDEDMEMAQKVRLAAHLRAQNRKWKEVADVLGYSSASSASKLKHSHRDLFHQALQRELVDNYLSDLEPTAIDAQLELIEKWKDDDDTDKQRIVQKASDALLRHFAKLHKKTVDLDVKHKVSEKDKELLSKTKSAVDDFKAMAEEAVGEERPDGQEEDKPALSDGD